MGQQITVRSRCEKLQCFYSWKQTRPNGLRFLSRKTKVENESTIECAQFNLFRNVSECCFMKFCLTEVRQDKMTASFSLGPTLNSITLESILWMFLSTETHSQVAHHLQILPRIMPGKSRSEWGRRRYGFSVFSHCLHIHIHIFYLNFSEFIFFMFSKLSIYLTFGHLFINHVARKL